MSINHQYTILITGGAGYLGSVMTEYFLNAGHKVIILDNFMFGQASLNMYCTNPNFNVVHGDSRNQETLKPILKKADIIIPLAGLVGAPLCSRDKIGTVSVNQDAIDLLVKNLAPSQKILIPISNSGYGIGEKGKFCTEESPLNPVSLYGVTKVEAEKIAMTHGNTISFRLATVFGMSPRMRLDLLVNDFVYRAVKDRAIVLFEAHFKRNYIHVRDVARAFMHGLDNFDNMRNEIYNVGLSTANLSKKELCEEIEKQIPSFTFIEAEIGEDPDKRDYIVSNDKIEATGFMPNYSLQDGIAELIKGYTMINNSRYSNV